MVKSQDTQAGVVPSQLVYLLVVIVEIVLAFRLLLRLVGVASSGPLISSIYTVSYALTWPASYLLKQTIDYSAPSFELGTLASMLVYAVMGYGLVIVLQRFERRA